MNSPHPISNDQRLNKVRSDLEKSSRLESLRQLTAGIAHELNNPIGGILGYSQFMLEKMEKKCLEDDPTSLEFKKYMEFIARESQRCRKIVKKLLHFCQVETINFIKLNVNVILQDAVEISKNEASIRNILVKTEIDTKLPMILGDNEQIHQVLLNLISNAIHAIPEDKVDGLISIKSEEVNRPDGSYVQISISDNGTGISKQIGENIFNPFFTTRPTGGGTGLGLSLSLGIIQAHQGELTYQSQLNEGTTFYIQLPCNSPIENND